MFWIMGGDALAIALLTMLAIPGSATLAKQFEHVAWEGFRFYDLIFPLFLFLVGCVLPFSLDKYRDEPKAVYTRIARRTAALFLLGLIANGLLKLEFDDLRIAGVLQRIGICYGIAALIFVHANLRGRIITIAGILLGYWALLRFVPAPGGVAGDMSIEGNLAGWLDREFLPGKILEQYYGFGDNEGILSTIPAIATALLGTLAGSWLRTSRTDLQKLGGLLAGGVACLVAGYAWGLSFPIIKNLWTTSFVLVTTGWSLLLLGLFYWLMDIIGYKKWALPFTFIGCNAITIYMCQRFIKFDYMSEYFFGGLASIWESQSTLILLIGTIAFKILFLWFLYSKKVFLRV